MKVTLTFLGAVRDKVGESSLVAEVPEGATYRDLLDSLAPVFGTRLPVWAWDPATRSFTKQILVSLNLSLDVRDETIVLSEGDELIVLPPLAGG